MTEKFINEKSIGLQPETNDENSELESMTGEIQKIEPGDKIAQERFRSLGFELGDTVKVTKKSDGEIIYTGKITEFAGVPENSENPPTLVIYIRNPEDASIYMISSYNGKLSGLPDEDVEIKHCEP